MNTEPYAYAGPRLREVAFPLGGIGAGCVSLEGRGTLRDWEIFNRPNKGTILPMTFATLWVQPQGGQAQARVVRGPASGGFIGHGSEAFHFSYGFGMQRHHGDGLPGFAAARFIGTFPTAAIEFEQPGFPLDVSLHAFSPFIPLDEDDSSFPAACLTYRLHNTGGAAVQAALAFNLHNAVGYAGTGPFTPQPEDKATNVLRRGEACAGLHFTNDKFTAQPNHPRFGSMALTTDWPEITALPCWPRVGWFGELRAFWKMFARTGRLDAAGIDQQPGSPTPGAIALHARVAPGQSVELPLLISWCFPNSTKYWGGEEKKPEEQRPRWTNAYAKRWPDAWAVAEDFFARRAELTRRTQAFRDALFSSTLPSEVIETVSATASVLHTPTCLRYEDGTFWGWEGCHATAGCCEGSCTHVWNYALTPAFLFPALHRTMRAAEYAHGFDSGEAGQRGAVVFRLPLPLGTPATLWHAAADGQLGGVVQLYRDWRFSGDEAYLRRTWPHAQRALEYAWHAWDADRDGLVEGSQHNTYDINFEGPNPLVQFFYLAALAAGERMARHLGDERAAGEYARLLAAGQRLTRERLYNGEYFIQTRDCLAPDAPPYQHGIGCLSDQVFGQLSASVAGLGHLVAPELIRSALRAIYRHNWREPLGDHENAQRIYALADESALILCTWPRGGEPRQPFPYSDENWTGFEYQVASHMLLEGMADEGLKLVREARRRYDGRRRNPYNEFECGSHYARAMSSWGLLLALSGFHYDGVDRTITLTPRSPGAGAEAGGGSLRSFFTTASAWGVFEYEPGRVSLHVIEGELDAQRVVTPEGDWPLRREGERFVAGRGS